MPEKLTTVYHPTLEGITQEVPADSASDWTEQGWLKSAPKNAASPGDATSK